MPRWLPVFPVCLALLAAACARHEAHGPEFSSSRAIPLGGAVSASVQVELGAGELRLEPGSAGIMDAVFRYTGADAKPAVAYDLAGTRGYLAVRQPPLKTIGIQSRDRWDLRLNAKLPLDLNVRLGAGQGEFKLGGMSVRRLDVEVGAGQLHIDLNGPWEDDLNGRIAGGVGEATVRLPRDTGVRIRARGGMGGIRVEGLRQHNGYYINDAYEKPGPKLRLEITGGIGQINLIG